MLLPSSKTVTPSSGRFFIDPTFLWSERSATRDLHCTPLNL
jgi:hypothetical protein